MNVKSFSVFWVSFCFQVNFVKTSWALLISHSFTFSLVQCFSNYVSWKDWFNRIYYTKKKVQLRMFGKQWVKQLYFKSLSEPLIC